MAKSDVLDELKGRIAALESSHSEAKRERSKGEGASKNEPSEKKNALKKIVALVNVSDRSERALRDRLAREEFDEAEIEQAISRAKDYGFIDDMRFAEVLIRSRISQGKGSAGIVRELAENGIDADTVPGWPFEYPVSPEEELDRALAILERKPPRAKNRRDAAYRRLVQKGYPSSVASSAARIWADNAQSGW